MDASVNTSEIDTLQQEYTNVYAEYFALITRAVSVTSEELADSLREEASIVESSLNSLQQRIEEKKKDLRLANLCGEVLSTDNMPENIRNWLKSNRIRPYYLGVKLEQFALNAGIQIHLTTREGECVYGSSNLVLYCVLYNGVYYVAKSIEVS
jgi:hypothetical protein